MKLAASDEQLWRKHQAGNSKDHAKSNELTKLVMTKLVIYAERG